MKVFVTGATGLIGAHTATELLRAGHEVRLLVRNKPAAVDYFSRQGFDLSDFVVADMLDKKAVKEGMSGCDAVVHAAAIIDLSAKNAQATKSTNLMGAQSVVGSACELGIQKILYVSSMSVFYNPDEKMLNEATPLADVKDPYAVSKEQCERYVRQLQSTGHPVISTYPAAVFGPDDPKLSESNGGLAKFVKVLLPITSAGFQFVDARDVALAYRLLLEGDLATDKTHERYMVAGHFEPWRLFADRIEEAAGHRIRRVVVPGNVLRWLGSLVDAMRRLITIELPISQEAMIILSSAPPAESSKLLSKTGIAFRPPTDTLRDTINWLRETKRI